MEGDTLVKLQRKFSKIIYLIIDEMSMIGRKMLGEVNKQFRQALPASQKKCSVDAPVFHLAISGISL